MSRLAPPDKLTILGLPVHAGIALRDIKVPKFAAELEAAWLDLSAQRYIGFDTESKPRFIKGEALAGPDLVQFATATTAYLFQLHDKGAVEVVRKLLSATNVIKVGFDLRQDQTQLMRAVNASARPVLDLDVVFRSKGFGRSLGTKNAVAAVFNRRFSKSKHITTSNWSSRQLDSRQIVYAANDAYVALQVFHALLASGLDEHKRGRSASAGTATSRRSAGSEIVRQQQRLRRHGQGHPFFRSVVCSRGTHTISLYQTLHPGDRSGTTRFSQQFSASSVTTLLPSGVLPIWNLDSKRYRGLLLA